MLPNSLTDSIKSKVLEVSGEKLKSDKITPEIAILNIVAKNFLLFPSIARDVNVAKQNMQILVKLAGGRPSKSKPSKSADNDSAEKENKDKKSPTPEKEDGNGLGKIGKKFLDKIKKSKTFRKLKIGFKKGLRKFKKSFKEISKIIIKFAKKIFTVKNITKTLFNFLKVAGPIGLIISIVGSIGTGFYDAFKEYQESGDIFESIKAGIGGMLEFLTFGLFGKKEIDKLSEVIPELWKDFTKAFFDFKESAIKFVSEKFTMILDFFNPKEKMMPDTKEVPTEKTDQVGDIEKKLKEAQDNIQALRLIKSELENDLTNLERQNNRLDNQISSYESRKTSTSPEPSRPSEKVEPAAPPVAKPSAAPAAPTAAPSADKKPEKISGVATEGMTGKAKEVGKAIEEAGITSPSAIQALVATAAKESGLDPKSKEIGAKGWLNTLSGRGLSYIYNKFPQLGPNGRVAKSLAMPSGVPADYLQSAWSKGDEAFFEMVYGGSGTNPQPGDGYKFRGRGFIQITGRNVYKNVGKAVGENFESSPDAVSSDFGAAAKAMVGYIVNSVGQGNSKKGFDFLNSLTDFKTALKVIIGNVAMGGLGSNMEKIEAAYTTSKLADTNVGQLNAAAKYENIAQASTEVSKGQREQLKPTDANVINIDKTNNKTVASNQTTVVDKNKGKSVDTLMARAA